jgi:hypothetical protein
MADKKIKIEVDLDAEPSIAQLKKLKLALKETTAGSEDWNRYKNAINDTEDALKSAGQGADNFAEIIGTLPGPLGELGGKLGSTVNTLKIFGGIKLDALKNSFTELGKDIGQAASSILKITGIQKLYTITTIAMSKALRFVGIEATTASFGVKAFSAALITTGIGAIVVALGFLISAFMNTGDEADTAATKVARLNAELDNTERVAKLRNAEEIARAKAKGATETELFNIKQKQTQEELDLARTTYKLAQGQMLSAEVLYGKDSKGYADAQKLKSEAAIKIDALKSQLLVSSSDEEDRLRKEGIAKDEKAAQKGEQAIAKRKAEREKEAADKLKTLEEITKNERAAALTLLDDREQEKRKIVNDYNAQIKLAADNGKETFILEEAKLKALGELKDKYKKEDDEKEIAAKVQEYENLITDIDYQNELLDNDYQADLQRLANKEAYLAEQKALELSNTKLTLDEKNAIIQKYAKQERQIDKDTTAVKKAETQARIELNLAYANALGGFGRLLGQIAGQNKGLAKTAIIIEQAAGIASIAINAKKNFIADGGIKSPLAWANLVVAGTAAIAAALAAKKGIEEIDKVNVPGGGGGGGSSVSAPLPEYSSGMAMNTPQINTTGGANPATQISQTIQNAQSVPIKAYVVSGEIASQQQLDRKANRGATFNLG